MEKLKKILTIVSICAVSIVTLMLILAVFGVNVFANIPLRIMLIVATIGIASGLSINELAVIKRKKTLGFVGLGLLALSSLLAIIIFATPLFNSYNLFSKLTLIISIISITVITIITFYSKLNNNFFALQLIAYIVFFVIDIVLSLLILGYNILSNKIILDLFIVLCIAIVGMFIVLSVLSARKKDKEIVDTKNKKMIMIDKEEYESLKLENENLKAEIESLKSQIENLKK